MVSISKWPGWFGMENLCGRKYLGGYVECAVWDVEVPYYEYEEGHREECGAGGLVWRFDSRWEQEDEVARANGECASSRKTMRDW